MCVLPGHKIKLKNIIMKKILVLSFAFAAITLSVSAQQKREPASHRMKGAKQGMHEAHHNKGMMMKDMNFTDAQKAQLKANRQLYKTQMQELNKNENITVKEQRDRKQALRTEQKAKMQALLTPEQKNKMEESKAKMEDQRKEMGEKRMEMMKTKLGLNDDQVLKMKAQHEATHAQLKAIKQDQTLSRADKKEKMKAIKDEAMQQRKSILSTEQMKKMEDLKKDHSDKDWKQSKK